MTFLFYGRFEDATTTQKHHKYKLVESYGTYEPLQALATKTGKIFFTLLPSMESGHTKATAPDMRLQGKKSFPMTGLYYKLDGNEEKTKYAYGYPPRNKTYGKADPKPNPFYEYRDNGFIFIFDTEHTPQTENPHPKSFELLIIKNSVDMIGHLCTRFKLNHFEDELKELRLKAEAVNI